MKILVLALMLLTTSFAIGQENIRIALTPRSNVSTSEVGKELDHHCPNVLISDDLQKANYTLEAWDSGAGPGRKPYKFTLFHSGDRVFSTETRGLTGAVKDTCAYIEKQHQ